MESDNLVLQHLRAIRETLDRPSEDLREIKGRLGILVDRFDGLCSGFGDLDRRLAGVEERLARIPL